MEDEEYLFIDNKTVVALEKMRQHYNGLVEAYEELPTLNTMRKVPLEDAISMIGMIMEGIMNELSEYDWEEVRRDEE
tara:strand:+ start:2015 stop:2245 length:231 start_codon:yes stop_codon:yes gene_type:complete